MKFYLKEKLIAEYDIKEIPEEVDVSDSKNIWAQLFHACVITGNIEWKENGLFTFIDKW